MSDPDDSAEKSHEATPEKLKQARRDGQIARSNDLTTAGSYLGFWLVSSTFGAGAVLSIGADLQGALQNAADTGVSLSTQRVATILPSLVSAIAPWMLVPAVIAILTLVAQQALIITPKNLKPKMSRISPLSNAKQKFGRSGLFEFFKSAAKLILYSIVLGVFLAHNTDAILGSIHLSPHQSAAQMMRLTGRLLGIVVMVALGLGIVDLIWQRAEHQKRNRMSRKELLDETKNSEGDPEMKHKRRSKGQEIALNQMLADVPKADVVVVNPTHYAVALAWDRSSGGAPLCVAKGLDDTAAAIRKVAQEHGVPIQSDPPTARALHATFEIGEEITPEFFAPVAAAIRFADDMRKKARAR